MTSQSTSTISTQHNSVCNIVIAGETGVGKSSLINLIVGQKCCRTGNDVRGVTEGTEFHDWVSDGQTFRLWDTPGLGEGSFGTVLPKQAQDALRLLLSDLKKSGGAHLLILCMRGIPRVTDGMKRTYDTVVRIRDKVSPDIPLVAVITELEKRSALPNVIASMEDWWTINQSTFSEYKMEFLGHACITTFGDECHPELPGRRKLCQDRVRDLIVDGVFPPKDLNVLLFGETGVGKSSLINLLAGSQIAKVSPDSNPCTLDATEYQFPLGRSTIRLWDTVGLEEPEKDRDRDRDRDRDKDREWYFGAIEKAVALIKRLNRAGGVSLLLFCIRGNRITQTTQSNYRLFYEVLGKKEVPIALAVTHLEREPGEMEEWWHRNGKQLERNGIQSAAHACVTTLETHSRYADSRGEIRKLMSAFGEQGKFSMPSEAWLGRILKGFGSFVKNFPRGKDLMKILTKRCFLEPDVAQRVAACIDADG